MTAKTKVTDKDGFTVEWAEGLPLPSGQQDAAFYRVNGHSWVCGVSKDGFSVDVYCDGDMRVKNLKTEDIYRDGADLISAGFTSDVDLQLANEKELLDWDMNPWFDMYVDGDHIDNVYHDIDDAVNAAKMFLHEEIENAKQIEDGLLDLPAF